MDMTKELKEAVERRAQVLQQFNKLKAQEQDTLQELLRLDGEVRLLERLSKDGEKPKAE